MKKIFIDNNIIIDFLAQTRPTHKEAIELFKNQKEDEIFCFSFGSISDIYYILNKEYDTDKKILLTFLMVYQQAVNMNVYLYQMNI